MEGQAQTQDDLMCLHGIWKKQGTLGLSCEDRGRGWRVSRVGPVKACSVAQL